MIRTPILGTREKPAIARGAKQTVPRAGQMFTE
jgi:hypothetical protein